MPDEPGIILHNGIYLREYTLPFCEWGAGEQSFMQFLRPDFDTRPQASSIVPATWWTCEQEPGRQCDFNGAPEYRPTQGGYDLLAPVLVRKRYYDGLLTWPDGSAAYGVSIVQCQGSRMPGNITPDSISASALVGSANGCDVPSGTASVLAEVSGGVIQHLRPALVRATTTIGVLKPVMNDDLTLAVQVYGSTGWQDHTVVHRTSKAQQQTFAIEAWAPAGSDVRVQLRGVATACASAMGYDLRDLRIQVETCIPDQTTGNCL